MLMSEGASHLNTIGPFKCDMCTILQIVYNQAMDLLFYIYIYIRVTATFCQSLKLFYIQIVSIDIDSSEDIHSHIEMYLFKDGGYVEALSVCRAYIYNIYIYTYIIFGQTIYNNNIYIYIYMYIKRLVMLQIRTLPHNTMYTPLKLAVLRWIYIVS